MKNSAAPPSHLSAAGKAMWRAMLDDFHVEDAAGLALLRVACDPGAAIEAGRFGRQQVERRFGLPAMVAAFEDAYASVLMRGVA